MAADIKELQELIEREKLAEEKVRRAEEEAQTILKTAREDAESIIRAIDSNQEWEKLRQAKKEEITRKKAEMLEKHRRKISIVERNARENFETATTYVTDQTLRVQN
jgi:vacuolar-type H+-ATPase subunit H